MGWLRTCIQNKLACYAFSVLSYYWCKKPKNLQGLCPLGLHHGPSMKLTMPANPCLHCRANWWSFFTKYINQKLNLLSKTDISKIAWIYPWKYFIAKIGKLFRVFWSTVSCENELILELWGQFLITL